MKDAQASQVLHNHWCSPNAQSIRKQQLPLWANLLQFTALSYPAPEQKLPRQVLVTEIFQYSLSIYIQKFREAS